MTDGHSYSIGLLLLLLNIIQETFLKKGDAGTSLTCEEELVGKILKKYNWGNRNCQDVMLCYVI